MFANLHDRLSDCRADYPGTYSAARLAALCAAGAVVTWATGTWADLHSLFALLAIASGAVACTRYFRERDHLHKERRDARRTQAAADARAASRTTAGQAASSEIRDVIEE